MSGIEKDPSVSHRDLRTLARQTADWLHQRGQLAADAVVLVPYAQLMPLARQAWIDEIAAGDACLLPRFLSTQQWSSDMQALQASTVQAWGWSPRMSLSHAQVRRMLVQTGLDKVLGGAAKASLIDSVLQAAQVLVPRIQSMHPDERESWLDGMRQQRIWGYETQGYGADDVERSPQDALEPALLRIALEWVGLTRFDTDVLWQAFVREITPALVVWQGIQTDGLAHALARRWGDAATILAWPQPGLEASARDWAHAIAEQRLIRYEPDDELQEALWATACVLRHMQQGCRSIGVVALDRAVLRRMHAMLSARQVSVDDTTGWKLSTTHAATQLISWLDAVRHQATTQEVLDAVSVACVRSGAQATDPVNVLTDTTLRQLERWLVKTRHFIWPAATVFVQAPTDDWPACAGLQIESWRSALQKSRSLVQWLADLKQVMAQMGLLVQFEQDSAGQSVLEVLHLDDPQHFALIHADLAHERLELSEFRAWVRAALEAESFIPRPPRSLHGPRVSLIPLSQVPGRHWDALVIPGCDELHLPWCPAVSSPWTRHQSLRLGLPAEDVRSAAQFAAWCHALSVGRIDVLSRKHSEGESLSASPLLRYTVQAMGSSQSWPVSAVSPMDTGALVPRSTAQPLPFWTSEQLQSASLLRQISPSAYEDLRRCPYRFHARRLLGLTEAEELSEEADKRDWGNWVHRVLHRFHALRKEHAATGNDDVARLDAAADAVQAEMRLDGAAFVPFRAAWPGLRDAYVRWLREWEHQGGEYVEGEVDATASLPEADVHLRGRLDRVDRMSDGRIQILDYKTESEEKTRQRVGDPLEDTQLAFYALLMEPGIRVEDGLSRLGAAYLNLGESGKTRRGQRELPRIALYPLEDLVAQARALREGMAADLTRLRHGHPLKPLGDGAVCEYCEARGLCRRDFWRGHEGD